MSDIDLVAEGREILLHDVPDVVLVVDDQHSTSWHARAKSSPESISIPIVRSDMKSHADGGASRTDQAASGPPKPDMALVAVDLDAAVQGVPGGVVRCDGARGTEANGAQSFWPDTPGLKIRFDGLRAALRQGLVVIRSPVRVCVPLDRQLPVWI